MPEQAGLRLKGDMEASVLSGEDIEVKLNTAEGYKE